MNINPLKDEQLNSPQPLTVDDGDLSPSALRVRWEFTKLVEVYDADGKLMQGCKL